MTMSTDSRREPWQTSGQEYPNLTPGAEQQCGLLISGYTGKLFAKHLVAESGSFGVNLPLLAPQREAADIYRNLYQPPDTEPGKGTARKAKSELDQSVKPAAAMQADVSRDKKVQLKKKKVNANRFRARPNKPTDWQ